MWIKKLSVLKPLKYKKKLYLAMMHRNCKRKKLLPFMNNKQETVINVYLFSTDSHYKIQICDLKVIWFLDSDHI